MLWTTVLCKCLDFSLKSHENLFVAHASCKTRYFEFMALLRPWIFHEKRNKYMHFVAHECLGKKLSCPWNGWIKRSWNSRVIFHPQSLNRLRKYTFYLPSWCITSKSSVAYSVATGYCPYDSPGWYQTTALPDSTMYNVIHLGCENFISCLFLKLSWQEKHLI